MKRIMLLGGNYFQMTATKAAKELGCYVISVDYLPDNPAHKFADEYHNVSTTDKNLKLMGLFLMHQMFLHLQRHMLRRSWDFLLIHTSRYCY